MSLEISRYFGAGEGIRTLDPNLGKVHALKSAYLTLAGLRSVQGIRRQEGCDFEAYGSGWSQVTGLARDRSFLNEAHPKVWRAHEGDGPFLLHCPGHSSTAAKSSTSFPMAYRSCRCWERRQPFSTIREIRSFDSARFTITAPRILRSRRRGG